MATSTTDLSGWIGRDVTDSSGDKIGKIDAIYVDEQTNKPEWLGVATGLFGTHVSFVPLASATTKGDSVSVPYPKDQVKDAPRVDPEEALSEQDEAALYRHYGLEYSEARSRTGLPEGSKDDAMTRSEEQLRVGKRTEPAGRVRLRKWVETEQVTQTVPVSREKARIEREPITEDNVDEEVVTEKKVVPKERVRLEKDETSEEAQVTDEVRKERIGVEGDPRTRR